MAWFYSEEQSKSIFGQRQILLPFSWIAGLTCGIFCALRSEAFLFHMMRRVVATPVSIVSLFCISFIPFLITVYSVLISAPWILFLLSFCRAVLLGFLMAGFYAAYGSAGWLMRCLHMICDGFPALCLFVYWKRLVSGRRFYAFEDTVCFFALHLYMSAVDYYIIAPFFRGLIDY